MRINLAHSFHRQATYHIHRAEGMMPMILTNSVGVINVTNVVLPHMRSLCEGSVVFIGSRSAFRNLTQVRAYICPRLIFASCPGLTVRPTGPRFVVGFTSGSCTYLTFLVQWFYAASKAALRCKVSRFLRDGGDNLRGDVLRRDGFLQCRRSDRDIGHLPHRNELAAACRSSTTRL